MHVCEWLDLQVQLYTESWISQVLGLFYSFRCWIIGKGPALSTASIPTTKPNLDFFQKDLEDDLTKRGCSRYFSTVQRGSSTLCLPDLTLLDSLFWDSVVDIGESESASKGHHFIHFLPLPHGLHHASHARARAPNHPNPSDKGVMFFFWCFCNGHFGCRKGTFWQASLKFLAEFRQRCFWSMDSKIDETWRHEARMSFFRIKTHLLNLSLFVGNDWDSPPQW